MFCCKLSQSYSSENTFNNNKLNTEMLVELIIMLVVSLAVIRLARRKLARVDYSGKVVWITGASSGIGESLVYQFNKKGAKVIISARNLEQLERVRKTCRHPEKVEIVRMDMTQFQQVTRITEEVLGNLKAGDEKLDVVVENAGVSMRCQFKDLPFENNRHLFDLNLNAPFNHLQPIVKYMIQNRSGHIVGITSASAKIAAAMRSCYAGSKNGFSGLLEAMRTELHPFKISVTNIMPGYVKTKLPYNALSNQVGKAFGSSDSNIDGGMDADQFADEAVRAIYNKQTEIQISKQWFLFPCMIALRSICPELAFLMLRINLKNQRQAIKKEA